MFYRRKSDMPHRVRRIAGDSPCLLPMSNWVRRIAFPMCIADRNWMGLIGMQGAPHCYYRRKFDTPYRIEGGSHVYCRYTVSNCRGFLIYIIDGNSIDLIEMQRVTMPVTDGKSIHRIESKGVPHVSKRVPRVYFRYTVSHRRGFPMSVTDENSIHSIALRGVPILLPTKIRYTVSRCRGFPCLLATEIRYTVIGMQGVLNFYTVSHRRGFPISVADTPYRIAEGSHVYY